MYDICVIPFTALFTKPTNGRTVLVASTETISMGWKKKSFEW